LSVQVRIFCFFPCILLLSVFKSPEMSGRKATLLHQVSSLRRSASWDSSGVKIIIIRRTFKASALEIAASLPCSVGVVKHFNHLIRYFLGLRYW
jgi:hypothetical protein